MKKPKKKPRWKTPASAIDILATINFTQDDVESLERSVPGFKAALKRMALRSKSKAAKKFLAFAEYVGPAPTSALAARPRRRKKATSRVP